MEAKTPASSAVIKTEVVFPNDTNPLSILLGGRLVEWMDVAAAVCAQNHAGRICVTASIDNVSFEHPAKVGDVVFIRAAITRAFTTSMEIIVEAKAKNVFEAEQKLISTAYFTFVALDENALASRVPPVAPETGEERELYNAALERKQSKSQKD